MNKSQVLSVFFFLFLFAQNKYLLVKMTSLRKLCYTVASWVNLNVISRADNFFCHFIYSPLVGESIFCKAGKCIYISNEILYSWLVRNISSPIRLWYYLREIQNKFTMAKKRLRGAEVNEVRLKANHQNKKYTFTRR